MLNLIENFQSIESKAFFKDKDHFSTSIIPDFEPHRLGKDIFDRPLILISILDDRNQRQSTPIKLKHLTVMHDVNCRISRPDETKEDERFTIIRCTGDDPTLQTYFLRIASTIITSLSNQPNQSDVSNAVNQLIELFRAMEEPSLKSIRGLWAEMYLISQAGQPDILINAWHQIPEDRYDFAFDSQRIEVKSYFGDSRQHHFSLEQLHPPESVTALVASVCVEESQAGDSILDLREKIQIRGGSDYDSFLQIDRIIAHTLGNAWQQISEIRYDERVAEESLAFFLASLIPSVDPNLPNGVSQVRFRSDLTEIDPVENSIIQETGGIFSALLS